MITRNERIIVEAVKRASSMSIRFNGVEIYVRNGDSATTLPSPCSRISTASIRHRNIVSPKSWHATSATSINVNSGKISIK